MPPWIGTELKGAPGQAQQMSLRSLLLIVARCARCERQAYGPCFWLRLTLLEHGGPRAACAAQCSTGLGLAK